MLRKTKYTERTTQASPSSSDKPRLLNYEELEEWRKDNEFILTGYKRSESSLWECLKSLGFVHNETGNIYTHLIPSCFVLLLLIFTAIEAAVGSFTVFYIGCATCLGISAFYHLLSSLSHRVASIGNKFDYVGICILIASSMIAIVEISFDDRPHERRMFAAVISVFGISCSCVSLMDTFRTPKYRPIRAGMFVVYGLSGIFPIIVGCLQFGYREVSLRASCPWLYTEGFMYIFGAFLYAMRFPEKQFPGKFDIVGHSHQIFHIFVVLGAYSHYLALVNARDYATIRELADISGPRFLPFQ